MRISTPQFQFDSVNRIIEQQAKLVEIQQQIASGEKIQTPSDDPASAARVLNISESIEINGQYKRNADQVSARLATEESTLTALIDVFQRVRELAVQGLNGTQAQNDRDTIAAEMSQHLAQVVSLAGTTDSRGEYIFSGYNVNQTPIADDGNGGYTYLGDQGQRQILIGPNRKIEDGDTGFDVFFDLDNTTQNAFSVVYNFAADLSTNTQASASLDDFDAVLENLSLTRSNIGARINSIDNQTEANDEVVFQSKKLLSDIRDLDYTEAISRLNLQQVALEAAQQSYVRIQSLSLFNFL